MGPCLRRRGAPDGRPQVAAAALVLVAVLLVAGEFAATGPRASIPAAERPVAHPATGAEPLPVSPDGYGPAASGRLFNSTLTPLSGVATSNVMAVDPTTQTGYSLNLPAGNLVAFNLSNGTSERSAQLVNPSQVSVRSIARDPTHHELVVSVSSHASIPGYLLVLNESTFEVVRNVSDPGGSLGFDPASLLYDPASGQVLVQNRTGLDTAILNTTTETVTDVLHPSACLGCAPYGYIDLPDAHQVWLPDGGPAIPTINTSTDSVGPSVAVHGTGFRGGYGTYDNRSGAVYVANATTNASIEVFSSGGTYLRTLPGMVGIVQAAAFVWTGEVVAFATYNTSYPGAGWEVTTWNGGSGLRLGHFTNPTLPAWEPGYSFEGLYPDVTRLASYLVTSGGANATVRFLLNATTGTLALDREYTSFPTARAEILADPTNGRYYAVDLAPAGVTAYSLSSGLGLWRIDLTYGYANYAALTATIDPVQDLLYVDFGSSFVDVYSTLSGGYLTSIYFPHDVYALADDSVHQVLYVADSASSGHDNLTLINTAADLNLVLQSFAGDGPSCSLVALPASQEVAAASCAGVPTTRVTLYSGTNYTAVRNFSAGPNASFSLSGDEVGRLYAPSAPAGNVTVFDTIGGEYDPSWSLGTFEATGAGVDRADGLGLVTSGSAPSLDLVNLTTGSLVRTFSLPSPAGSLPGPGRWGGAPAFVAATSMFLVPIFSTGQRFLLTVVPLPRAPAAVTLSPGNGSLAASWSPSVPAPGYPVSNYSLFESDNGSGPWTPVTTVAALNATLSGLTNGRTYFVGVQANSGSGASPLSLPASGIPLGVPYPPTNLSVGNASSSWLLLTWTPPVETQGAPVLSYSIEYTVAPATPSSAWNSLAVGNETTGVVGGLKPSTTYVLQVIAANSAGPGHPSATTSGTTLPGPGPSTTGNGFTPTEGALVLLLLLGLVGGGVWLVVRGVNARTRGRGPGGSTVAPPEGVHATPPTPPAPPPT